MCNTQCDQLVLAVDGGQTHSMAVIARADGVVLGACKGGPANHFLEEGGPQRFTSSMRSCIEGAFNSAGLQLGPVCASHYCLTGVHEQMEQILQAIAPTPPQSHGRLASKQSHGDSKQSIQPDRLASLWGATQKRPAVLILSGTGSIAYGIATTAANSKEAVSGGWGYAMGDEGSASWITPQALSAATRAIDGCGAATMLSSQIPAYFGVETLHQLHPLIYTHQIDRVKLAEIASVVSRCAELGDVVAIGILADAARHLGNAVIAVIRTLGLEDKRVIVTSAGGVFKAGALLVEPMMQTVHGVNSLAEYVAPRYPPIIGALLLAIQSCGMTLTDSIYTNIEATSSLWTKIK